MSPPVKAVVRRLKLRAAQHDRSAEEEHREILRAALLPAPRVPLHQALLAMPAGGSDDDFTRSPDVGRTVEL